ncbi:hypothetical protein GVO57_14340 (plasmid) [Sphingomonas changnyeongensis]|uniref:Uncharacterized protein n=1 Tax=Sphingomonas changnyeongensis TaxID=2698679 RepID=A0A7Z2NZD9_9SPHN|nr:hypothetical protein [Sphingomonas changnyeongensis]QHL92059.1 hypothetical protein GVO57_14340 [Sphingomonas changnyeongensis]
MGLFNRIFAGQRIDEWASDNTLEAARTLNQVAGDLIVFANNEIAQASLKNSLFNPAAFIHERIAPRVRSVAESVAVEIVERANSTLLELVEEQAVWSRGPEHTENPESAFEGASDIVAAAAPLAIGAASAVALPFVAVTTSTALFGLISTTAISWPILLGGGAIAGVGIATGVVNTAKIRDRSSVRLQKRARQFIVSFLIEGSEQSPAVLQRIASEFEQTAKRAKKI